ncbi:hypothetical protein SAE01_29990 [Segetibacter aerophilus]|uniref:Uncharacterized protein n=1 Tax=Segetibacter aerophilus TaxID=670293 RepID=A0A512BEV6_9BACT|nr:hypothetical protein SAE01_29990 [Segetibacter aerophilus]
MNKKKMYKSATQQKLNSSMDVLVLKNNLPHNSGSSRFCKNCLKSFKLLKQKEVIIFDNLRTKQSEIVADKLCKD